MSFSASYSQDQGLSGDLSLDFIRFSSVPEPGTLALFAVTGFFGVQWYLRRKPVNGKKSTETGEPTEAEPEVAGVPA
ncbi:MAG: PEP-CTERM sorting domain-containing protein [Gemmatales bacterium]